MQGDKYGSDDEASKPGYIDVEIAKTNHYNWHSRTNPMSNCNVKECIKATRYESKHRHPSNEKDDS